MTFERVLVASNRGPVTFREVEGELVPRRGSGGLVTALAPAVQDTAGLWVAAAMGEGDRKRTEQSPDGRLEVTLEDAKYILRLLSFDQKTYDHYYNDISNRLLWFLHHYLWDLPREPALLADWREAWRDYTAVNATFAEALARESRGATTAVLVQDYHLSLVPAALRRLAPDVRIAYFHHVPFAAADYLRLLPHDMREDLLTGLLGADLVGFHTERWAENFLGACRLLPGTNVMYRRRAVRWQGRLVRVGVYPIAIDAPQLRAAAGSPRVRERRRSLERWRGDRKLLLRVDRTDLSKNLLRGFQAYDAFLRAHPGWRRRVVFLALLNPSRRDMEEYRQYTDAAVRAARDINEAFGDADWTPVELRMNDEFAEVLAAYQTYDALMVNPVFDGMNLVAKEGVLLNRRQGVLILSRTAGAHAELGAASVSVDPVDVAGLADAIVHALEMPEEDRARRATALRRTAASRSPTQWANRQLRDLERIAQG
ncbi:MAG: trehalose-6-phosphate synthase [Actinomycetota bacterium]|nr:trehalose-6-phosphate synthase [Actinomycetota bacterium]